MQPGGHLCMEDRHARDVTIKQSLQKHEVDLCKPLSSSEIESLDSDSDPDVGSDIDDDASSDEDSSEDDE